MPPYRHIAGLVLLLAITPSCRFSERATFDSAGGALAGGTAVDSLTDPRIPRAVAGEPKWRYEQSTRVDLDGDGTDERVVVISDVELSAGDEPLWEDGHRWQVYIEEPDSSRLYVYARFLPNGKLTAEVADTGSARRRPSILLLEQTPSSLGLYEIAFDGVRATVRSRTERTLDPTRSFVRRIR